MNLPFYHQNKLRSSRFYITYVHQEEPVKSNQPKSEKDSEVGDSDLLEVSGRSLPHSRGSHHPIGRHAVEHARSAVRLRRGWWSLFSPLSFVLTMLESLSVASSFHSREDEALPHDEPQPSNAVAIAPPPEAPRDENIDTPRSSRGILVLKRWMPTKMKKGNTDPALHELAQAPRRPGEPPDLRSPSQSPARVDAMTQGPSWMAAGKRKRVSALS